MIRYGKETLREIWAGIGVWTLAGSAVVLLLRLRGIGWDVPAGFWLGCVCAFFYVWHLAVSLETALDYGEEHAARRKSTGGSLLRYAAVLVIAAAASASGRFHMLGFLAGLLGIKTAVYLQPVLHRLLHKENESENEEKGEEP